MITSATQSGRQRIFAANSGNPLLFSSGNPLLAAEIHCFLNFRKLNKLYFLTEILLVSF